MRIGVTLENSEGMDGNVCMHFGQCTNFLIVDVKNDKVASTKVVPNTAIHGGGGCQAVDEILKHKITHVIAGGMGMGAQQKFAMAGVKIFGYSGKVKDGIDRLLLNKLEGIDACKEHGDCQ